MAEAGSTGADPGTGSPGRRTFLRFAAAAGGASLLSACSGKGSAPAASGSTARGQPGLDRRRGHVRAGQRCFRPAELG